MRRDPPEIILPAVMAALEAGRTLNSITMGRGGPLIVRLYKLRKIMAANPEWAHLAAPLIAKNAAAATYRKGSTGRNKTHCPSGHSMADAYIVMRKSDGYRCRQCRTCHNLKQGRPIIPEIKEKIEPLIKKGEPLTSFAGGGNGRLITHRTLVRWRNEDPVFNNLIEAYTPLRIKKQYERMGATNHRNAVRRRLIEQRNIYHKIRDMVPAWVGDKDELVSDVFVLIGGRMIQDGEIKGYVAQAVSAHSTMFPGKFRKFGNGRLISLDQLAFEDGSTTIGDQVSRGLWD